jgi:hypothetical protein
MISPGIRDQKVGVPVVAAHFVGVPVVAIEATCFGRNASRTRLQ